MTAKKSQASGRDSWYYDNSVSVNLPSGLSDNELRKKLKQSRKTLEELKTKYCRLSKKSQKREAYFHEIVRIVNVISALKDNIALDGEKYDIDEKDIEPPELACKRLSCFIAGHVFGDASPEARKLREFRDNVLECFLFGRVCVKMYYSVAPALVSAAEKYGYFTPILKIPIVFILRILNYRGRVQEK